MKLNETNRVANRISAVIELLTMDKSVQITGKSSKQLKRYSQGSDLPVSVLKSLAGGSETSAAWLLGDGPSTVTDTKLELIILQQELAEHRTVMKNEVSSVSELKHYKELEETMLQLLTITREHKEFLEKGVSPSSKRFTLANLGSVQIPRYGVQLSAGNGHWNEDELTPLDYIPFTREFLQKKLNRKSTNDLLILEASGDSMLPTIAEGDLVLVDQRLKTQTDGIFAFVQDGLARVKRFKFLTGGRVQLVSDNKELYTPETLSNEEAEYLHIIGRVCWIGHTV